MKALAPRRAGLLLALLQAGLLLSLGAVVLIDRARLPRAWGRVTRIDPDLPIRGRYVSLTLLVPAPQLPAPDPAIERGGSWQTVTLVARAGRLEAIAAPQAPRWAGTRHQARIERVDGTVMARLNTPLAYFIPPQAADPSWRPAGEELWVEVSLPGEGAPRPIRLGVRRATSPDGTTAPVLPLTLTPRRGG